MNLDDEFEAQAQRIGVSSAKLKCVYFRGIREFDSLGVTFGTPAVYGLARVQKYINSVQNGTDTNEPGFTEDELILAGHPDEGIEMTLDNHALIQDVVYGDGNLIAAMFAPAVVSDVSVYAAKVYIHGSFEGSTWEYILDTATGEAKLALS